MLAVIGKRITLSWVARGSSGRRPSGCSSVTSMHPSILWSSFCSSSWVYDYDVAIVGGGIVGASVAASLAQTIGRTGAKIALIEAGKGPPSLAEALVRNTRTRCYGLWDGGLVSISIEIEILHMFAYPFPCACGAISV